MRTVVALLGLCAAARLLAARVVYAVNCGSAAALRSADGFVYAADARFSPDTQVSAWDSALQQRKPPVRYTDDAQLYATERWASGGFSYRLPVPAPGHYVVITQHAENAFAVAGQRVWRHQVGEREVDRGVDAAAPLGHGVALNKYYEVEVRDGGVYFMGDACPGGYVDGEIVFGFAPGDADNPMVNGIVVVRGRLADTDQARLPDLHREYDRRYEIERMERAFEENYLQMLSTAPLRRPRRNEDITEEFEDVMIEEDAPPRSKTLVWVAVFIALLSAAVHVTQNFLAMAARAEPAVPLVEAPAKPAQKSKARKAKRE